ncbi:DoxX family protein [Quadrisphaera sp. KR29]|uniref:DoxX family protein n=1 Tax=Quadrisphaera sp. KR29 TaxID=3461391 RepID=UPI004044573C
MSRRGPATPLGTGTTAPLALAALLGTAGVAHLAAPGPFERIVPRALGRPGPWVAASGVAELACAAGLLPAASRRWAGLASAALLVAVFPANATMAVQALRSERAPRWYRAAALARLPLQLPLVAWALRVAGAAHPSGRAAREVAARAVAAREVAARGAGRAA